MLLAVLVWVSAGLVLSMVDTPEHARSNLFYLLIIGVPAVVVVAITVLISIQARSIGICNCRERVWHPRPPGKFGLHPWGSISIAILAVVMYDLHHLLALCDHQGIEH